MVRSYKLLGILATLALCFIATPAFAQDGDETKQPLDLPVKGLGSSEDDEDAPETINFYGTEIEGDGFFFCVPNYGFCGVQTEWETIKTNVVQAITKLSTRTWFGLVAYNSQAYPCPVNAGLKARRASNSVKTAAVSWLETLHTVDSCVITQAGLLTIKIAKSARGANSKQMIFMGGNKPSDSATALEVLTAANSERLPLHTKFVATVYSGYGDWWQELALMNNGSFEEIR